MSVSMKRIPIECVECGRTLDPVCRPDMNAAIGVWLDVIDDLVRRGWFYNDWTDRLICPQCTRS